LKLEARKRKLDYPASITSLHTSFDNDNPENVIEKVNVEDARIEARGTKEEARVSSFYYRASIPVSTTTNITKESIIEKTYSSGNLI